MAVCESIKSELERQLSPEYTPPECAAPYKDHEWLRRRDFMARMTVGGRMMDEYRLITVNDHLGRPETTADAIRSRAQVPQGRITILPPSNSYDRSQDSC